jgi:surfeit locus 1 family protein
VNLPLLAPRMVALHVVAVVVTVAGVLLGVWQYDVWKQGREQSTSSRVDAAPRSLDDVISADGAFPRDGVGQPVRFTGRWLPSSTLYVDGQISHGRRGVWVVTPVAVCDEQRSCSRASAVLVVRGWAASRSQAPTPPRGKASVTGWLQPGEGSSSPIRIVDQVQRVPRDLYSAYVIANTASGSTTGTHGLTSVTPANLPRPSASTSLRNLLYALEWWAFAGFAVYAWWRWCRDEVSRVTGVRSNK